MSSGSSWIRIWTTHPARRPVSRPARRPARPLRSHPLRMQPQAIPLLLAHRLPRNTAPDPRRSIQARPSHIRVSPPTMDTHRKANVRRRTSVLPISPNWSRWWKNASRTRTCNRTVNKCRSSITGRLCLFPPCRPSALRRTSLAQPPPRILATRSSAEIRCSSLGRTAFASGSVSDIKQENGK